MPLKGRKHQRRPVSTYDFAYDGSEEKRRNQQQKHRRQRGSGLCDTLKGAFAVGVAFSPWQAADGICCIAAVVKLKVYPSCSEAHRLLVICGIPATLSNFSTDHQSVCKLACVYVQSHRIDR